MAGRKNIEGLYLRTVNLKLFKIKIHILSLKGETEIQIMSPKYNAEEEVVILPRSSGDPFLVFDNET